ncbi:predicted protein [Chaetoceros tenuissimus]|uniref:Uncharacterized protein n=1 Tax=Chaetoceros tenuissimus TaxID=426638 RepID=A0AAD3CXT2_9STRA|nr:predicted protein [Chaetoceros tenuissimus]
MQTELERIKKRLDALLLEKEDDFAKMETNHSKREEELKHQPKRKGRQKFKLLTPIPPQKELDSIMNFNEISEQLRKLNSLVRTFQKTDMTYLLEITYYMYCVEVLLGKILNHYLFKSRSRSSLDWLSFPKIPYVPNCIVPQNQFRTTLQIENMTDATENELTNDNVFPEMNVADQHQTHDIETNKQAECSLQAKFYNIVIKSSLPMELLLEIASICYKTASFMVHIDCFSTAAPERLNAIARVYYHLTYHEETADGGLEQDALITLIDQFQGDENICIHHMLILVIEQLDNMSEPEGWETVPKYIFMANPSERFLELYPCPDKLQFNGTNYCGIPLDSIRNITAGDVNSFMKFTKELQTQHIDFFEVKENKFTLKRSDGIRDPNNQICAIHYNINKFGSVFVKGKTKEEICKQMNIFARINEDKLGEQLRQCGTILTEKRGKKSFKINLDGYNDTDNCVFQALVYAISCLDERKVSQLKQPSGAIAFTKPSKGLSEDSVWSLCQGIGMTVEYVMMENSVSDEDRLKALLERSFEVDDKMLLVSLGTCARTHSHCICVDLTRSIGRIWNDRVMEFSRVNLNKCCKPGSKVKGIPYIICIKPGMKQNHKRNGFKRKREARKLK